MSMFNDEDVLNEGFKPLKKTFTSPTPFPNKPHINRAMSFNAETGAPESDHKLWEIQSNFEKSKGKLMERSNSFYKTVDTVSPTKLRARTMSSTDPNDPTYNSIVLVVDPFSTGSQLASAIADEGYKVGRVFSIWDSPVASLIMEGSQNDYIATIQHNDRDSNQDNAINETVAALKALPYRIVAILAGAETGVQLADSLSHRMGLRSNGEDGSLARRNKYYMGEAVRNAGHRAVLQAKCSTLDQVKAFIETIQTVPFKCVCKPTQSGGSDDIFLCNTKEEALVAFKFIHGKINGLGLVNDTVLVQEFLVGKEYVIDKVSRDGVHKLVAIWEYDKRSINNAHFIYFGMRLMKSDSPKMRKMIAYADGVLDALGIKHGPSHMEVMFNEKMNDCCLVEVGARCHGGEGTWVPIAEACIGYTVVSVTVSAYLDGLLWNSIPKDQFVLKRAGRDVDLVNRQSGIIRSINDTRIRALPSFFRITFDVKPGDYAHKTHDCFTRPGCVQLLHDSEEQAEKDLEAVHLIETQELFDYTVICPTAPIIGSIVVVDPFSSGVNLAAMVLKMGYKLILIFSESKDKQQQGNIISKGYNNHTTVLIQHDSTAANQTQAINDTIKELSTQKSPILAILSGSDTGVDLSEKIASSYGTRSNGELMISIRRNKYLCQETIKSAGLKSIRSKICKSESDIILFAEFSSCSKYVVKSNQSSNDDTVFVCSTKEELSTAYQEISSNPSTSTFAVSSSNVLCQEFVDGVDYVVDGVSRDGIFKVTSIWEYDKRYINNAYFVKQSMRLCNCNDNKILDIISYANQVVTALGIKQGPSCIKIKHTSSGSYLIELKSCIHGGNGTFMSIVNECIGYSQLEVLINCYVRPDAFDSIPAVPKLLKQGVEIFLVNHKSGVVKDIDGLDIIVNMQSFLRSDFNTQPGNYLLPTIDSYTCPGSVQLVNQDMGIIDADIRKIRQLELEEGLFSFI